ncbi:neuropeptide CCHamide-1 receptor-like [Babylonia areolata]|uniref:neuropeptide CCHamide-1 receptor-like n=1 Tax=Babylonia areolata TaxID=304850 RepID=UPI003FD20118
MNKESSRSDVASYPSDIMDLTLVSRGDDVTAMTDVSEASSLVNMTSGDTPRTREAVPSGVETWKSHPQAQIASFIYSYHPRLFVAIGFPGNLLSLITILRMKPRSRPSIYVAVLAVTDTLCLTCDILDSEFTRYDVAMGNVGCKLLTFTAHLSVMYASGTLVMMNVERFLAVWMPLKVGTLCTDRTLALALGLVLFGFMALNSFHLVAVSGLKLKGTFGCSYKEEYHYFKEYVWAYVGALFYALLPCILLIIFNILIVLGIKRAGHVQRQLTEGSQGLNKVKDQAMEQVRQQRQITLMLVMTSVVFVILIFPYCIYFIYEPYWRTQANDDAGMANFFLTSQIVRVLANFNHVVNFFIYFISTKKFRESFLEVICFCRKS